jgi:ferredoxin--NADP+ reductase
MQGVPYDSSNYVIPHVYGCVKGTNGVVPGLYVAGWAKRGPDGIIDATLRDSMETFRVVKHHLDSNSLPSKETSVDEIKQMLGDNYVDS